MPKKPFHLRPDWWTDAIWCACVCVCGGVISGERVTQVIALPKKLHPSMGEDSWKLHLWSLASPGIFHLLSTLISNAAGAGLPRLARVWGGVGGGKRQWLESQVRVWSLYQGMLIVLMCEGLLWIKPQLFWFLKDNNHVVPRRQGATPRSLPRKGVTPHI